MLITYATDWSLLRGCDLSRRKTNFEGGNGTQGNGKVRI